MHSPTCEHTPTHYMISTVTWQVFLIWRWEVKWGLNVLGQSILVWNAYYRALVFSPVPEANSPLISCPVCGVLLAGLKCIAFHFHWMWDHAPSLMTYSMPRGFCPYDISNGENQNVDLQVNNSYGENKNVGLEAWGTSWTANSIASNYLSLYQLSLCANLGILVLSVLLKLFTNLQVCG